MENTCDIYSTRLLHMWQVLGPQLCFSVALGFCSFKSRILYVIFLYSLLKKAFTQRLSFCCCHFCSGVKNISKAFWASEPSLDSFQLQCCGFLWNRDAHRLGCVPVFVSLDTWMQMEFWQLPFVQQKTMLTSKFSLITKVVEMNWFWETEKLIPGAVVWFGLWC